MCLSAIAEGLCLGLYYEVMQKKKIQTHHHLWGGGGGGGGVLDGQHTVVS